MEDKINEIIKYGKKYGEVEVTIVDNISKGIQFKNKRIHRLTNNKSSLFMIRITNGRKYGFSTFNTNWKKSLKEAVKNMKYNTELKAEVGLPKKGMKKLNLVSKIKDLDHEEILEIGKKLIDSKFEIPNSNINVGISKIIYGNKEEIKSYEKSVMSAGIEMKNKESIISNFDEDINEVNVESIKEEAEELARMMKNKKKINSGKYDIIFEKDAKIQLIDTLLKFFDGNMIYGGIETLYRNKNKKMFSDELSMKISSIKKMSGSYSFDAEGNKGSEKYLIKNGLISGFIVDRYLSRVLKEKNPFNASGLSIPSQLNYGNIILEKGKEEIDGDFKLYTAMGWHTVDLGSGNVSISVDTATVGDKSIKGGMISFNIFEAFKDIEIGNEYERIGNFLFPKIKIKNVQFTS